MHLEELKMLIDEENYPYYTDEYLTSRLASLTYDNITESQLIRELLITKSSIPEIKLGDITIPAPKDYFLLRASGYRMNATGVVVRADAR